MKIKNMDYTDKEAMENAVKEAAEYIRTRTDKKPDAAIVLGSGLGKFAEYLEDADILPFDTIPNFPQSTVEGHNGKLFIGEIKGRCVAVMQGRVLSSRALPF
jgi:purine-nucleoside phosphorylase